VTSQDRQIDGEESFGTAEKHFSFHSLEKILGLLACIIPNEPTVSFSVLSCLRQYVIPSSCLVGAVRHVISLLTECCQCY